MAGWVGNDADSNSPLSLPPPPVIVSRSHIARVELGEVGAQGELSGEKAREEVCRRLGKSQGITCGKNASSFEEVF